MYFCVIRRATTLPGKIWWQHINTTKNKIDLTNLDDDDTDNEDNNIEDNNNNEDVGKYYILNISDQCDLTNGFRYIKELLLQHHNHKMFSDSVKLEQAGINIYSVK